MPEHLHDPPTIPHPLEFDGDVSVPAVDGIGQSSECQYLGPVYLVDVCVRSPG